MSTAQESIVRDLEARQVELQTAIQNAVRGGGGSMQLRNELKTVQQQLTSARNDHASTQAAGRQAAASVAAKSGAAITAAAIDRVTGASAPFSAILAAGVPAIDFTGHAALESASQNLAAARKRVADAESAHGDAMSEVSELAGKAQTKRDRHAELSRQRVTGEAGEGSASEMYAASVDVKTLDAMHATAKTTADGLLPPVNAARIELKSAESSAARVEFRIHAEHLVQHAKALEAAMIDCLRDAQAAAQKAGATLGGLMQPSADLRHWIATGAVTRPFASG